MPETTTKVPIIGDKTPRICEVCGKECIGAGGLGAHMSTHYRKGEVERAVNDKYGQTPCPHCDLEVSKTYMTRHLRRFHPEMKNREAQRKVVTKFLDRPRVQIENLSAREVCRVVLEQALTDGMINLNALDAYQQWVEDTEKFLGVLYR